MNIVEAIHDQNLFRPFLGEDLASWENWFTVLKVVYGLGVGPQHRDCIYACTGRDFEYLPDDGFDTALLLTGRRSGKSRIAAVIGAFEAALAGHETKLSPGERGLVLICAPTKLQGRIVKDYLRAIFKTPLLQNELVRDAREGFELKNGTRIEILAGDWRTVRGYTCLAAIVDEAAFFGYDAEAKVKSDAELIKAIKPSLATVSGKLIAITSPYARKGWTYTTYKKHFGNDSGRVLVWNCPSRTMNLKLSQKIIDDAMAEDPAAARSEYLGEFRDDVGEFISRAVIEGLVVPGRQELLPRSERRYFAFADLSGGRGDDGALAIAHREDRKVIVDLLRRYRPPYDPRLAIQQMADEMRRYNVRLATGDNYAADFVVRGFESCGIRYTKTDKARSLLYAELLPRLCSSEIELLDNEVLVNQLASLERRTRSGGRDIIDHPPGGHDDLANVVAGVAVSVATKRTLAGAFGRSSLNPGIR